MKIAIFSEMFPKKYNNSSGIFIIKRIEQFLKMKDSINIDISFYPISYEDDVLFALLKKMFGIAPTILPKSIQVFNKKFPTLKVSLSFSERISILTKKEKGWINYAKKIEQVLLNTINKDSFDILHAHRAFPEGLAGVEVAQKLGIPLVITVHGGEVHSAQSSWKKWVIYALNKASKVIFVSDFLRRKATELGYDESNSIVIPNGYDPEIFYPVDKIAVRKELGIYRKNTYYIGFVGNLIKVKRADKLGEIFHHIANRVKNVKFIVVGDGPLLSKVKKETKDLDIIFTVRLEQRDVAKWMNAMDVMILPSRNEGFGAVVIEAQACGTAVVGSSNGGIPEAIEFNEFVVEEGEDFERRFAGKVIEVLKNGYDSKILIERVKGYTWESIVRKEVEVYKEVLNENTHSSN